MNKLNILVTGGAGFIGSHIVEELLGRCNVHGVRILDNFSTGSMENIKHLIGHKKLEIIYGDIRDLNMCKLACENINAICHQAAYVSVPGSITDPILNHDINVNGFINLLIAAKENNIKRVVYASSSAIYGDSEEQIDNNCTYVPLSPYGLTKSINESYGKLFTNIYAMECIGLRYCNVYGPKQDPNSAYAAVIPKFINGCLNGCNPVVYGDGSQTRDFIYVMDIARANVLALTTLNTNCWGECYNVGTGASVSVNKIIELIGMVMNKSYDAIYENSRAGDIMHSRVSVEKIRIDLEFGTDINLINGIEKTIEWLKLN